MKKKRCTPGLVLYEILNIVGNPFTAFFGIIFPVLMLLIISNAMKGEVPASMAAQMNSGIFITMSLIVPLAMVFLGYCANYSQELEKDIPIRMRLFGFREGSMILAKIIAQFITLTLGLILYTFFSYLTLDLLVPKLSSGFCLLGCIYLLGAMLFAIAHGLASLLKKFGPTYAAAMILYFGSMILCGMMGIQPRQLPAILRSIAALLPMSYISSDFIDFWTGGTYNFMPMIQSYLFLGAVSGILLVFSIYKNRRVLK